MNFTGSPLKYPSIGQSYKNILGFCQAPLFLVDIVSLDNTQSHIGWVRVATEFELHLNIFKQTLYLIKLAMSNRHSWRDVAVLTKLSEWLYVSKKLCRKNLLKIEGIQKTVCAKVCMDRPFRWKMNNSKGTNASPGSLITASQILRCN